MTITPGLRIFCAVGVKKGAHVTVYSTEEAGKSIAHAFEHP
ncbi:MAG: hypothetical protein WA192_14465 [Candidatus Acidiferrales bacterium]